MIVGAYPQTRLRRLRQTPWMRSLLQEHHLTPNHLIWPIFVREDNAPDVIPAMPGVRRLTVEELTQAAQAASDVGIPALMLFPFTPEELRTPEGKEALNPDNIICRAVRHLKKQSLNLGIICDVALDPYTDHGHDGVIVNHDVHNDATVEVLRRQALVLAEAGADMLAPSDMMDGRIFQIRQALDKHAFERVGLISYAVKFASSFYGPFRSAVGVEALRELGDKKTYQLPMANTQEALREIVQDVEEGADSVIIKPGLPYLDIIRTASDQIAIPLIGYQVSGEYAMLQAAAQQGWFDGRAAMLETLYSFKRAGAQAIITYAAYDMAKTLVSEAR